MKKILLVGLGQLGTRYLEGIRDDQTKWIEVHLLEHDAKMAAACLEKLKARTELLKKCKWHNSIDTIEGVFDIVAVITSASDRPAIVSAISDKLLVKNWLLEKVLSTTLGGLDALEGRLRKQRVWVNTPRRLTSLYSVVKNYLPSGPVSFDVNIKGLEIGCNSIHFIDLLEWLTGETLTSLSVIATTDWFDAKRRGYKEFDGQIIAEYSAGSELRIDNVCELKAEGLSADFGGMRALIDEERGVKISDTFLTGRVEYQSELMGGIIQRILETGECDLPTLTTSLRQHRCLLQAILETPKLRNFGGGLVPIT